MTNISIHDNIVTSYTVFCNRKELIIATEFQAILPYEKTVITFYNVEAYLLTEDNMQSILFDITECPIEQILIQYSDEFIAGTNEWPGPWNNSIDSCHQYFAERKCKAWLISSSFGMKGFVIAGSINIKQE